MTAKTYGQVLLGAQKEFACQSLSERRSERIARAVILEFIRRVEERAADLIKGHPHHDAFLPEEIVIECMVQSFDQLSTELKEAK